MAGRVTKAVCSVCASTGHAARRCYECGTATCRRHGGFVHTDEGKRWACDHCPPGTYYNGPEKRYVRCHRCGHVDYEANEGDRCHRCGGLTPGERQAHERNCTALNGFMRRFFEGR